MTGWTAILISVPITFVAAWFGGRFHALIASSHVRIQTMLSFVGGLMLGMALLHLVPHAVVQIGSVDQTMYGMLGGLIGVFLLIRFLHVHSHASGTPATEGGELHAHTHFDDDDASGRSGVAAAPLDTGGRVGLSDTTFNIEGAAASPRAYTQILDALRDRLPAGW
ncbi:MAG: hypothetical protein AAFS11_07390, partial [Planctomycetota bacterium]